MATGSTKINTERVECQLILRGEEGDRGGGKGKKIGKYRHEEEMCVYTENNYGGAASLASRTEKGENILVHTEQRRRGDINDCLNHIL